MKQHQLYIISGADLPEHFIHVCQNNGTHDSHISSMKTIYSVFV